MFLSFSRSFFFCFFNASHRVSLLSICNYSRSFCYSHCRLTSELNQLMSITRISIYFDCIVVSFLTMFVCLQSKEVVPSTRLDQIFSTLPVLRPDSCRLKFENCLQDLSYADQLNSNCNIYSRIRDCYHSLFDHSSCLSDQFHRYYHHAKQNEYKACSASSSFFYGAPRSSMLNSGSRNNFQISLWKKSSFLLLVFILLTLFYNKT